MTIRVDQAVCRGHARCIALVPEAFDFDDVEDKSRPKDDSVLATVPKERLQLAVDSCPENAIRWVDES